MLPRVRITKAALASGSAVAVCFLVFGTVCSVDRAGLSNADASSSRGGSSGGNVAAAGGSPATAGTLGGSGNSGTGGAASGASGGANPAGGTGGGPGGAVGLGGAIGIGGDNLGSGGDQGSGGIGSGGDQGSGGIGSGGNLGSGGDGLGTGGGSGGATSTGGVQGSGGAAGDGSGGAGTGGTAGTRGSGGMMGSGGAGGGHAPSCSSFPTGSTFTPPTDNVLHCYWTHSEEVSWETAEATCENEGGTLATILSSQENMAVLQVGLRATLFNGGTNVVWLGASDGKQSNDKSGAGKYAWVTGEAWSYTNWHANQPDGSCTCSNTSMCACDHWLAIGNDGTWYDRDDGTGRPYVCEAVAR
jgi:Lectin C-type domain